jgi:response regulator RpfG family c-di-GMP phosphodiesterase
MTMTNTVLLVDDELMVLTALRSFLELETPYRVLTFTSPLAALDALGREPVDVIIADFMMPELDGISFLHQSRVARPLATRVLLTGYADKENAIRAINEAGLYYYLEKPWSNEHLKLVVRNGIERSTLFTELDARVSALEHAHQELYDIRRRLLQAFL